MPVDQPESVRPLSDVFVEALRVGGQTLPELQESSGAIDERAQLIPKHAIEAILEADDRFVGREGVWQLADDAPVAGLTPNVIDLADEAAPPRPPIDQFVVIDLELTGLNPETSEIIEIAGIKVRDWEIIEEFQTFVSVREIPPAVTALTSIDIGDVRGAPTVDDAVESFLAFIGDLPVLGHNVGFDIAALKTVDASFESPVTLDTLELAHVVLPRARSRTLSDLASYFGIEHLNAHRALDDCKTTLAVAIELVTKMSEDAPIRALQRTLLTTSNNAWARLLAGNVSADVDTFVSTMNAPWQQTFSREDRPKAPSVEEFFRRDGPISSVVKGAEPRPAQVELATEVATALSDGRRLLIEAPTGTGKTLGYLIPGLAAAAIQSKPLWISTHTKSLQTQLQDEFARLTETKTISGKLAVLKGKRNYLCTRDLMAATATESDPLVAIQAATLISLLAEADEGEIGEVNDFWLSAQSPSAREFRSSATLNPTTCEENSCEFYAACPYFAAKSRSETADLVVINHSLLASLTEDPETTDLAGLIIDEAHNLESAFITHETFTFDPKTLIGDLDRLIDTNHSRGLLRAASRTFGFRARSNKAFATALESVRRARKGLHVFADRLVAYLGEFVGKPAPHGYPISHWFRIGIDDHRFLFLESRQALRDVVELLQQLRDALRTIATNSRTMSVEPGTNPVAVRRRLIAESARIDDLIQSLTTLLVLSDERFVVYATWEFAQTGMPQISVARSPIDVSEAIRFAYQSAPSIVATSATLAVAGGFSFMRERLAADDFVAMVLPPTFDYESQASLILTRHLPPPRTDRETEFVDAVADTAIASIGTSRGGALVLFTARSRLDAAFNLAEPGVRFEQLDLRAQTPDTSARELASWFIANTDASMFALRSFWEGFDAPGETLRLLMIEKIPFPSPADPHVAARMEALIEQNRDPFLELTLPMAALALKQGFGRLIRTRSDRGVVVVLDRRLRTGLTYQAELMASFPDTIQVLYPEDESEYLDHLAKSLGTEPRHDLATGVGPARSTIDLDKTTLSADPSESEFAAALAEVLRQFQIPEFRSGQEELIRAVVLRREDAVALLPTGSGKSLVYQASSMLLDGVGLVISPLVALMKDQVDELRHELGFPWAFALFSGQTAAERDEVLDSVRQGGCRLLYVSPERLRDRSLIRALQDVSLSFIAVDEAHCVSAWGHDFRPDFLSIMPALAQVDGIETVPRLALTATAPAEVLNDVVDQLGLRSPHIETRSIDRPNIHFSVITCKDQREKRSQLLRIAWR